ncbi:hypothetical protein EUTSA_v10019439mg [Eutrema salsugineum]|uniref:FHA domain-containing protein n=1 Tax=Eutrema salsugineum TaxID=72664 RepID=V4M8W7_EUTSA|nr:uncharacterized protein LOC18008695 [Eutrema salsugineum]ESQ27581.1 hypothetical protein EUTSA_v10019439mg [Eutrema salsugineum]
MAFPWIPEDDFRLRKSIENGASLESLAKGAVKFSRRFTLSELTDRWHSLLYSPQVKSLSSSIGFDLEHSDQFLPQSHHHHYSTPVRTQYYTARKRMRLEEPLYDDHNNHVAFGGNMFGGSDFFGLQFDDSELEIIKNTFQDGTHQQDEDGDDDRMANQLLNINDGEIQDCFVTDTTTLDQFFHQEEFQDPLFRNLNASFIETTSLSHEKEVHEQAETHQDLPSKQEGYSHGAMSLSKLDPHPEIKNGECICTINQACSEVPNNDDINLQLYKPRARNSINPSSLASMRKHTKPPLPPIRGSSFSQGKGNDFINMYGIGDCDVTEQASCSSAFKNSFTEKATFTATTSVSQQHFRDKEICEQTFSAEMDIDASMSEEEQNHNEIESDEDLPSFSDVEAMVLDMDLEPVGQDRYELEASRYRNEEMARMIMRLEQSSKSYMNRIIASHGAFAILYGSSKHYINKPEVLLGRATGEYPVDIDLGRSRSGTKVSRRQALIRLKQDGCFEIKNLGKFSIWLNEKEIEHRETVNLKNNSLIQIREMSFVFETNEKAVKRYLDGIHK